MRRLVLGETQYRGAAAHSTARRVVVEFMNEVEGLRENKHARSLAKGLVAGLIGGLGATAAKTLAEKVYPPRTHGEPEPLAVLADKLAEHHLVTAEKETSVEAIHWGFGALTGAAYGALA